MMFDAFDIFALSFFVNAKQRKKPRQRFVPFLNPRGNRASFVGQNQAAIFFVIKVTKLAEFLHHARDGSLFHFERGRDVHDAGVTFLLDQFVNSLEIIFRALARLQRHVERIKRTASDLQAALLRSCTNLHAFYFQTDDRVS